MSNDDKRFRDDTVRVTRDAASAKAKAQAERAAFEAKARDAFTRINSQS